MKSSKIRWKYFFHYWYYNVIDGGDGCGGGAGYNISTSFSIHFTCKIEI